MTKQEIIESLNENVNLLITEEEMEALAEFILYLLRRGGAMSEQRERDAKVAESLGVYPELNIYGGGPDWYKHGQAIAKSIREGR